MFLRASFATYFFKFNFWHYGLICLKNKHLNQIIGLKKY